MPADTSVIKIMPQKLPFTSISEQRKHKGNLCLKIHEMENWNFLVKFFFRHLSTSNIKRGFWLNNNVVSYNLYREINSTCRLWKLLKMTEDERQASSWGITSILDNLVLEWRHVMEINSPKVPLILNNKAKLNRRQFSRRLWIFSLSWVCAIFNRKPVII